MNSPLLSIMAGYSHVYVVMNTNPAQCWGNNNSGQLGNGLSGYFVSPTLVVSPGGLGRLIL